MSEQMPLLVRFMLIDLKIYIGSIALCTDDKLTQALNRCEEFITVSVKVEGKPVNRSINRNHIVWMEAAE